MDDLVVWSYCGNRSEYDAFWVSPVPLVSSEPQVSHAGHLMCWSFDETHALMALTLLGQKSMSIKVSLSCFPPPGESGDISCLVLGALGQDFMTETFSKIPGKSCN